MAFNSITYFVFLLVVFTVFYSSPRRWRKYVLLVSSYIFYGAWDWRFCGLIFASTAIDYFAGLKIENATERVRRAALIVSLTANLGILGVFKYAGFFVDSFCALAGIDSSNLAINIILPVGISFFTFQSMSYTIDVYRGLLQARRDFAEFALYVAFFPQLVAGPIVKAREFFPQFDSWSAPSAQLLQVGISLIVVGLVKKMVLADNFARIADAYFSSPAAHPGFLAATSGVAAFSCQIFFDFSGYSDMAIGSAALFGYRFPENFRRPYLSRDIAEFWRRWHISLSSWLRDYLYIPLGGNRSGASTTYRNLMITMLLGGLWHGASWNFVIWGGLHGLMLVVHRLYRGYARPRLSKRLVEDLRYQLACWVLTLLSTCLAWVFFRSHALHDSLQIVRNILAPPGLGQSLLPFSAWLLLCATFTIAYAEGRWSLLDRINRSSVLARSVALGSALLALSAFADPGGGVSFIYFQF